MTKRLYEVKWKEDHFAEVEAENETEAFTKAAEYSHEHDTRVDEDEYECQIAGEPDEAPLVSIVIRDEFNIKRAITLTVRGESVIMEDYLKHPIESYSRSHRTVMDDTMLDELIRGLGYIHRDEL